jgi:hypothetical protein
MAAFPRSPVRQFEVSFVTPRIADVLFTELVDCTRVAVPAFGTPHPNTIKWPHHELVFAREAAEGDSGRDGMFEFFYAAKRNNQDDYNFEQLGGEQVVRTYVVKRDLYFARPVGHAGAVEDEFLYPPAGAESPDIRYSDFCFADDTQRRYEKEFDSVYVVIQRRFIRPVTVDYVYDEQFRRIVRITKEVIPRTDAAPSLPSNGSSVEIQSGNNYHSIRITKELVLQDGEVYPYQLPTLPGNQDFRFPSKLESVSLVWAYAYAAAEGSAAAYATDSFFKPKIIDPRPGPYSATVLRFVTDDPEQIKVTYPLTKVPQPVREAISDISWWQYSSEEYGNKAQASAKEWAVPSTIHGAIFLNEDAQANVFLNQDPQKDPITPPPEAQRYVPTIEATPGVAEFLVLTEATIGYQVREMPFGLFEVTVIKIDIQNLYG